MHAYRYPEHEQALAALARAHRLRAGLGEPRSEPADEARLARRHDGRRCLPVRRSCAATSAQVEADLPGTEASLFMQSSGGLTEAHRFQGKDAILSGPAGGIVGAVRGLAARGLRPDHRFRHGRHVDRCHALRRRVRARFRHRSRRRAAARADDADSYRSRRRRLDLRVRRRALSRRPGVGRRQSGTRVATAAAAR